MCRSRSGCRGTPFHPADLEPLVRPINLRTLNSFIRQGYPRELLFWLFTDSFQLNIRGHLFGYHYAPPDDFGCSKEDPKHRCFVDWVHDATLAGLTVEEKTVQMPPSARGLQTATYAHWCFSPVSARAAQALAPQSELERNESDADVHTADIFAPDLVCGGTWDPLAQQDKPQPEILPLTFTKPGIVFSIVPRSAYGVFEFLGTLMKMRRMELEAQAAGQVLIVPAYFPPTREDAVKPPWLITVLKTPRRNVLLRRGEPTLRAIVTCTLSISSDNPASRNQSAMSHRLSSTMANGPSRARGNRSKMAQNGIELTLSNATTNSSGSMPRPLADIACVPDS